MASYGWRSHLFDLDDDLVDQTTVALVAPGPDDTVRFSLTVTRDQAGEGGLKGYVDGVLRELVTAVPGFRLLDRSPAELNKKPAIVVNYAALSPEAGPLTQIQGFGDAGDGDVVIVTATATTDHEGAAKKAFERLWTSWRTR